MKEERIQAPDGVRKLLRELWLKHLSGDKSGSGSIYWVDLPEPTEEEKRIMAINRANRKPVILDESELQSLLDNATEKLGGW
ncbi:MAG: hypothetical protein K2M04_04225 [Muribaculaceae bacterium]|nr:hypothetical protein [Muribaculaceae bacterium]